MPMRPAALHRLAVSAIASMAMASCAPSRPAPPATTQPVATPRDLPGVNDFAWVSGSLCRGAQPTRAGLEQLKSMGIKTVIDLRGKSHLDDIDGLALKYVQIPSSVSRPDEQQIIEFLRVLRDPQNRPAFVHDEAGADRTGLYVGAYHIVEEGWTANDVDVELARFHFDPYWAQVRVFLHQLNPDRIRRELSIPPTTTRSTTRGTS